MDAAPEWIVSTIDNKIVSVSLDYTIFASIVRQIARLRADSVSEIHCRKAGTEEIIRMSKDIRWEDLRLFGTEFQKTIWRHLFDLTHGLPAGKHPHLLSYSGFADLCGKKSGVRAVAHAIGQNPIAVIIPCHLIIPKETMDRIEEIERQAENSLFGTDGLILDPTLDFGEYRYGKDIKKFLLTGIFPA